MHVSVSLLLPNLQGLPGDSGLLLDQPAGLWMLGFEVLLSLCRPFPQLLTRIFSKADKSINFQVFRKFLDGSIHEDEIAADHHPVGKVFDLRHRQVSATINLQAISQLHTRHPEHQKASTNVSVI